MRVPEPSSLSPLPLGEGLGVRVPGFPSLGTASALPLRLVSATLRAVARRRGRDDNGGEMSSAAAKLLPFPAAEPEPVPAVLLVGNPNVGKSVLFKNLTNHYVTVSNYPGTTVEVIRAKARLDFGAGGVGEVEVIDSPGLNDLTPHSDDARVTRRLLFGLVPGSEIELVERQPAYVIRVGETELALDAEIAREILIEPA